MKNILKLVLIFVLTIIFFTSSAFAAGLAHISIKVEDEFGKPINAVHLKIRFTSSSSVDRGLTDANGNFDKTFVSDDGVILGDVTKDGYYESGLAYSFYVNRLGRWEPWGKEITVVMRPIINPVPMYVRNSSFKVPEFDKEIGFDLERADWVAPYGLGAHSDFIFKVDQVYDNMQNFNAKMTLTFTNPSDGIQVVEDDGGGDFNVDSIFRLPRIAPEAGYLPVLEKRNSRGVYGRYVDRKENNNYIFRIRSEVDKNGNIKQAMYGKIRGDIWYAPGDGGKVWMNYYLNPDHTPNLEFDPKRNLFVHLPREESTQIP